MCPQKRLYLHVEQKQQLATPTYKACKEPSKKAAIPTLVDHADYKLLGRIHGDRVIEETLASKKKNPNSEDTPKASKKKASKCTTSDDLNNLDEKWSHRIEAMIRTKPFCMLVELVQKTGTVVTSNRPFFAPEKSLGGTSEKTTSLVIQPSVLLLPVPVL